MKKLNKPRIFADFHNADPQGRLRLNCNGTKKDLADQNLSLHREQAVVLYSEELEVDGMVQFSEKENLWVAAINWATIKNRSLREPDQFPEICESFFSEFVESARIQCRGTLHTNPDSEGYFRRGVKAYQQGQYEQAIDGFTKAIELEPRFADAYFGRAMACLCQPEYDRTIEDCTRAINLKPSANAYFTRAQVYLKIGNFDCAVEDYTETIKLEPGYLDKAYYLRGLANLHLERWKEAKSDLGAARKKGLDIVASFQNGNTSMADFERTGTRLPEEIAAMLTSSGT